MNYVREGGAHKGDVMAALEVNSAVDLFSILRPSHKGCQPTRTHSYLYSTTTGREKRKTIQYVTGKQRS